MEKKTFSEHLKEKLKDIKAKSVARKTGVSETKISDYKRGEVPFPSFKNGIKLMQELNIKAKEIDLGE